jgi:toxin ParE1/3/4
MNWTIRLAFACRSDIARSLEWSLETFGETQHDAYLALIGQALKEIGRNPNTARSRARPEMREGVRTLHIARRGKPARHFFVYRVNQDRSVDVARFLHDAMDVQRHLPDEFKR